MGWFPNPFVKPSDTIKFNRAEFMVAYSDMRVAYAVLVVRLEDMIKAGNGAILVTGNTSAIRGKANFAGFAPTKAAQRILSESIARDLGPRGIHVAYVLIDAVIDVPRMRQRFREAPDEFFIKPSAIADELWHLYNQDRSAWSFLAELRPFAEKW